MAPVNELPAAPVAPAQQLDVEDRIELGVGWLLENKNRILAVVTVGALIWIGILAKDQWHTHQMEKANDLFFTAENTYRDAISETAWASPERIAKMKQAREEATKVREQFPNVPLARTALLLQGDSYYFSGDALGTSANTGEAIRLYEEYLREAATPDEKAIGSLALGYANENRLFLTGDSSFFQPALDAYEAVRKSGGAAHLRYEATNSLARLYAYTNDVEKAKELYLEVYKARYKPESDLSLSGGGQEQMMMNLLRDRSRAFTVGTTARTALLGLGVDVEAMEKDADAASAGK